MIAVQIFSNGSPPHTRGKVSILRNAEPLRRITPAHAGKRWSDQKQRRFHKDHPRTRGEKDVNIVKYAMKEGSPPHTRGKALPPDSRHLQAGITPAHAGKRSISPSIIFFARDHPRTRGEKFVLSFGRMNSNGSPPHTRGKVSKKTFRKNAQTDHPRTRGEKLKKCGSRTANGGSPPHTRGKVIKPLSIPAFCRITPAHAGKSLKSDERTAKAQDHPRTRGEKCISFHTSFKFLGSPPHTRGKAS